MQAKGTGYKKLKTNLKRLFGEQRGVAYLEFALALPFLLLLFAGSIDVTRMVLLHQKVDKAVFTVGDLATQIRRENGVCNTIRNWEYTVVRDMVKPFNWDRGNFQFILSSVIGAGQNNNCNNSLSGRQDLIEWRYNANASGSVIGNYSRPYCQQATMPNRISGLGTSERVIVTEMSYNFYPLLDNIYSFRTTRFRKASYFRSRLVDRSTSKNSGNLSGC